MSADSEPHRPSFRFRDKFSRFKDRLKDKVRDKAIKHNITLLVHQNLTANETNDDYSHSTRHGFRQQMHHMKDVLKNKTHYESLKEKIKEKIDDKLDLHDNKTYPKGFYDSLFSSESENDVYLQTALICLWIIAVLCIIPTIIVIFLPARKKSAAAPTTSTNMIFFHVFFCELCYLTYVLLAMVNVAKDFRLGSTLCDFANYGMYVTIPIMQFALLFLSLERLFSRFNLSMTWGKIFTKPYLIQVILCAIWIFLIALVLTFMFIRKQFSFSFVKDQISHLAPPIVGDLAVRMAGRRHHCSIDGRLSSVFKTVIIILFIILIVKPIAWSLGFNLLSPFCCKNRPKNQEKYGDRRTTKLVTIFLLLNFFFSFPFYFASMFKSIFTRIDSTKETFSIVLKICFILRITNIIFECLAFYIFERNSWNLLRKVFYYGTCKKFPIFNATSNDDSYYIKDAGVRDIIDETRDRSDDEETRKKPKKKRTIKKPLIESEPEEDDDDGAFVKTKKKAITKKVETPVESDDETPIIHREKQSSKKPVELDEDETDKVIEKKRKSQKKKTEIDEDETIPKRKSQIQPVETDQEEEEEEERQPKSRTKKSISDDEKRETTTTTKRKSRPKVEEEEEEAAEEEIQPKFRTKKSVSDDEKRAATTATKRKSRSKVEEEEEEGEEEELIEKPKSKPHRTDPETRIPNGTSASHRPSSATNTKSTPRHSTSTYIKPERRATPSLDESEADTVSNISEASSIKIKPPPSSRPIKTRPSSTEQKPARHISPNAQHSRHRTESPSRPRVKATTAASHSHHSTKKHRPGTARKTTDPARKPKKDRRTRILEMSDEV